MDQGLALVIITGAVAVIYLGLAIRNFVHGRASYGVARLFAAVLFAAAAVFVAVQMRLF